MAIHIADAYVDIEAKDQTHEDVDRIMQRLRDLGPVEIELQVKDETREESEKILRRLKDLGPVEIALRVDDQTAAGIAAVEARLHSIRSVDIGLRLDNQTGASLAELRTRLNSLGPYAVRVSLDVQTAELDEFRARLEGLGPYDVRISPSLDTGALEDVRARLDALGPFSVDINLDMDLTAIRAELDTLRGRLRIPVEVDNHTFAGLAEVYAEFLRFRFLASNALRIPVSVWDHTDGGMGEAYLQMLMFRQLAEHTLRIPITTSNGANFPGMGGGGGGGGAGQGMGQGQLIAAAIIGGFPAIAVAAAGAVTLAFGAAFAALPVMAWKSSAEVNRAYSSLWMDAKRGLREMTPAWEHEVSGWTNILRDVGASWSPLLKDTFEEIRPAVTGFFVNFGHGLEALKPMVKSVGEAFPALLGKLGPQMGQVLDGLGSGFKALMDGISAHPEMFGQLLIDIAGLVEMIGKLGEASMALLPAIDPLYGIVGDLNNGIDNVTSGVGQLTGAVSGLDGVLGDGFGSEFLSQLWDLGKGAMAVANGPVTVGIYTWQKYKEATDNTGIGSVLGPAIQAMGQAATDAAGGTEYLTATGSGLIDMMKTASMTADELKAAFDRLTKAALDEWDALTGAEKAIDKMTASIKENGHTLDANTAAGRANRDNLSKLAKKFQDYIEAMKAHHEPAARVEAEAERLRKKFYEAAFALTGSSAKAKKLTDDLLGLAAAANKVPASKRTKLLGDLSDLQTKLNTAMIKLALVPPSKRSKLLGDISDLQKKIRAAQAQLAGIPDQTVYINVIPRGTAAALQRAKDINYTGQAAGSVRTFASGGETHVAQIARPGEYRLWAEDETGGEAYIPLAAAKRRRSLAILDDVARRFGVMVTRPMEAGGLMSFAGGGTTPGLMDGGKGSLTELGVGMTAAQAKAAEKAAAEAEKAAAALKKLLTEIGSAGKKLLEGITKAMLGSLDKVNAYAENLNEMIKKYLSGSQEKAALKWANAIENKMRAAATSAEELAATIKEAKEFAASTAKTLVGGSDIGSLGAIGNAQDVKGGLQFRAAEMQRFADQLGQLAQRGLNKDTILEIVGYGPQQGGALADMLLKDTSTFAAINSAQGAIEAAAANIGNLAADQMYDTGAHAADGFLTGLYAKQKDLQALMGTLGEQLAAGIKKVVAEAQAIAKAPKPKLTEEVKTSKPKLTQLGVGTTKKRASGGIVEAGDWALVGEQGPELVGFGARGNVHTATQTAGMLGGVSFGDVHIQVHGTFDFSDPAAAERVAEQIAVAVQEKIRIKERSKR